MINNMKEVRDSLEYLAEQLGWTEQELIEALQMSVHNQYDKDADLLNELEEIYS